MKQLKCIGGDGEGGSGSGGGVRGDGGRRGGARRPAPDEELRAVGTGDGDPEGIRGEVRDADREAATSGGRDDGRDARRPRLRGREQAEDDHHLRRYSSHRVRTAKIFSLSIHLVFILF